MNTIIKSWLASLWSVALLGLLAPAIAQTSTDFPARRIAVVLPYPGGGIVDIMTRIVTDRLAQEWGQTIVVEPKPGANGNVAWDQVARAEPDGYTWTFLGPATIANPRMQAGLRWSEKSFTPVAAVVWSPLILVVHPSVPANTLDEFIDHARKNPGTLNWANAGIGSSLHLNTAILLNATKLKMVEVSYKGQPPAIIDLMANRVHMMIASIGLVSEHIKNGTLKPIAVIGKARSPLLPNVPTMIEAGHADINVVPWWGFVTPNATPQAIVDKINAGFGTALKDKKVRLALESQGFQVVDPMTPSELASLVLADTETYAKVITESDIKIGK